MNICRQCGACCACYRVSFHWYEASDDYINPVPVDLTERVGCSRIAMRRRSGDLPRCIALSGEVGSWVTCQIYDRRPSICRDFNVSWEDGICNPLCDNARLKLGLPPLGPLIAAGTIANKPVRHARHHTVAPDPLMHSCVQNTGASNTDCQV